MDKKAKMRKIRMAIAKFAIAAQDYAFVGAEHPDDREAIILHYEKTRRDLEAKIEEALL